MVHKCNMFGLGSIIFAKKSLKRVIQEGISRQVNFGNFGIPEKGCLILSFQVYDNTFIFVNCHLPSGQASEKVSDRVDKITQIHRQLNNNHVYLHDMLFWAGDFNIRCFFDFTKARVPDGDDLFHPEDLQEMRDKEEVTYYA